MILGFGHSKGCSRDMRRLILREMEQRGNEHHASVTLMTRRSLEQGRLMFIPFIRWNPLNSEKGSLILCDR